MKVLHVVDYIDSSVGGGTAERSYQLARALIESGDKGTILSTSVGVGHGRLRSISDIEYHLVPVVLRRFLIPWIKPSLIRELVSSNDVVHLMGHWSILCALVGRECVRQNIPYVFSPAGSLGIYGRSRFLKKLYNLFFGNSLVSNASSFVAVTSKEAQHLQSFRIPEQKILVVPNGVPGSLEKELGDVDQGSRASQKPVTILFLGRLSYIKGPDILLESFISLCDNSQFENVKLLFAGPDDGMLAGLRRKVREYALDDRVEFLGYLDSVQKFSALRRCAVLVVPSRQEAMSLVALEAGIVGTPVLLTNECGFDEVQVVSGGAVCKPYAGDMADHLLRLLSNPEELQAKGRRLQAFVKANYTWKNINQMLVEHYKRLSACRNGVGKP